MACQQQYMPGYGHGFMFPVPAYRPENYQPTCYQPPYFHNAGCPIQQGNPTPGHPISFPQTTGHPIPFPQTTGHSTAGYETAGHPPNDFPVNQYFATNGHPTPGRHTTAGNSRRHAPRWSPSTTWLASDDSDDVDRKAILLTAIQLLPRLPEPRKRELEVRIAKTFALEGRGQCIGGRGDPYLETVRRLVAKERASGRVSPLLDTVEALASWLRIHGARVQRQHGLQPQQETPPPVFHEQQQQPSQQPAHAPRQSMREATPEPPSQQPSVEAIPPDSNTAT